MPQSSTTHSHDIDAQKRDVGSQIRLGVLTSGGDAQGMNAAVRGVVRAAFAHNVQPYAIYEGWSGAVEGGDAIRPMTWEDSSNILFKGGTVIGTARCPEFRDYEGRHKAARNLVENGIDRLVVIGGDGSLSGTDEFRSEWGQHLQELFAEGVITDEQLKCHSQLNVVGLVGSIDNDMVGTDITIGADTALHRIVDAIDQLSSTAASHQRTFVIEVMGRHCGYLPLMGAIAGGADYVFIPENPVGPGWEDKMCEHLSKGRAAGRRESIIVVAEGATDQAGNPVTSQAIVDAFKERTGEDARVTILGHVQRGGTPSAYDRWMPTILAYAAVQEVLNPKSATDAPILGIRNNRVARIPLAQAVARTRSVKDLIAQGDYKAAQEARGSSFVSMMGINDLLSEPPSADIKETGKPSPRVAIIHAGGLAPGMNTAAKAAVRMGISRGWTMLGVQGSWEGLADNKVRELGWSDVEGWGLTGGAQLGTRRTIPEIDHFYGMGRAIESNKIDALLVVGGVSAYHAVRNMVQERKRYPSFRLPIVLVPASIDNNIPGTELAIGADSALNNAVWALERIKESAAASRRCFVAEVMGRRCGYLTLMSAISSGAEYAYLHERPLTLEKIDEDAQKMRKSFEGGRNLFLVLVNEEVSTLYDTKFLATVFEAESQGMYDVRHSALGHLQQGGTPSPFDRILATRLTHFAMQELSHLLKRGGEDAVYIGVAGNRVEVRPVEHMDDEFDWKNRRPHGQWWLDFLPVLQSMAMREKDVIPAHLHIRDIS